MRRSAAAHALRRSQVVPAFEQVRLINLLEPTALRGSGYYLQRMKAAEHSCWRYERVANVMAKHFLSLPDRFVVFYLKVVLFRQWGVERR